jgi:hypothetical protein
MILSLTWEATASGLFEGCLTLSLVEFRWVTLTLAQPVIHQVAQAGFPEEPPKDEQAMLIHAEFSDSAGPEKAPFSVFPLL